MKKLMVTRFNNETWAQHQRWREKNDYQGCIKDFIRKSECKIE